MSMAKKEKKDKKEKIRYVDDGSTVVDMQAMEDSRRRPGEKPYDPSAKGTLKEQFRTYFAAVKLMFWPTFIFAIIQSFYFRERKNFWCVKLKGTLTALALIPVLFYTYNGVIGKSPDWINITIFFISAAAAYIYEFRLFKKVDADCRPKVAIAIFCLLALLFVIFTFATPEIGIFKDPISGTYGI